MTPEDPRHGTERGAEQHSRDDETPCPDCYEAKLRAGRRRTKRKTMGHRYTMPAGPARERLKAWLTTGATYGELADHTRLEESQIWGIANGTSTYIYTRTSRAIMTAGPWPVTTLGVTRRVRALCRMGWSIPRIADACRVHPDTILDIRHRQPEFTSRKVRDGVVAGFTNLAMQLPEGRTQQEKAGVTRARNYAAKQGWPPPLAWIDIDDPTEVPEDRATAGHAKAGRPRVLDVVVEDFDWLVSQGESPTEAARRLGVRVATVETYRGRLTEQAS